ncbi:ArnT family glycosyltransferase [Luteococcus sp.]|uniref:ArnT family glycosyltransferase n=1 Tax=Luteococcus sp. TaxID=1969402 RepID=UPI00373529BF
MTTLPLLRGSRPAALDRLGQRAEEPTGSTVQPRRGRTARILLGDESDPAWARPGLWALLALSAMVYLWNLTNSGYANDFYAAAVKSGTQSWTAWLFGSLDSANAITVDKPPASLWVMGLSARLFGFSSFSLLLPQALMGIGTVATVAAAVRRWHGHAAGLVAGALVLVTPVAAMMFRFDNPDAMLTLLMSLAGYCVVRAIETSRGRTALRWMVAAGAAIGFAFLTKMLQGMLVLPGFVLAYALAAPRSIRARLGHLLAALLSMVVSAGWFVALVSLWPAARRAYIGGSTNNSLWELALGYNGLGRILGGAGNGGGGQGGGPGGGFSGSTGITRMFNSQFATETSWFLPAALILLLAGLAARGLAPRTDRVRASLVVWGGWMVSTALVLSFMEGTVHTYYAIALTPGIAATIAVAGRELVEQGRREGAVGIVWRTVVALAVAVTAGWGFHLLETSADGWNSWLRWVALVGGLAGALAYLVLGISQRKQLQTLALAALIAGSVAAVTPAAAWTVATVNVGHTGSMPTSGPAVAGSAMGGMGGGQRGGTPPTGTAPTGTAPTGTAPTGTQQGQSSTGSAPTGNGGGDAEQTSSALTELLNSTSSRWSAAVIGDQTAAGYILDSDTAVMSIGGWSGSDENVTLEQFKAYVANGDISYFISGGGRGGPGGDSGSGAEISQWVQENFTAKTVGGATVYDLTSS